MVTMKTVCRAFRIYPSQIYQMSAAGRLPLRKRGVMTAEFLHALAEWHYQSRGPIPPEAAAILRKYPMPIPDPFDDMDTPVKGDHR